MMPPSSLRILAAVRPTIPSFGLKSTLTGGTSFVPAVRRLFADRFGADKIEAGDELVSIANGLALIGERDDIDQWTV